MRFYCSLLTMAFHSWANDQGTKTEITIYFNAHQGFETNKHSIATLKYWCFVFFGCCCSLFVAAMAICLSVVCFFGTFIYYFILAIYNGIIFRSQGIRWFLVFLSVDEIWKCLVSRNSSTSNLNIISSNDSMMFLNFVVFNSVLCFFKFTISHP